MKEFDLNIGKILEDWEIYHAIREIIANALDEQILTNTQAIEIIKERNSWCIRDFGRGINYHHLMQNENPEKTDNEKVIGRFGVGLKDALATLYRHNVGVEIRSKYGIITLKESTKNTFDDIVTLHAQIAEPVNDHMIGTEFYLFDLPDYEVYRAKDMFLLFSNEEVIETTSYGQIIAKTDDESNIYVNGVKVATEPNFAFSYNITSLSKQIKKALNRERTNVGRTAYADRIKAILCEATNENVVNVLSNSLESMSEGTQCDEIQWKDVAAHFVQILNTKDDTIFVTPDEIANNNGSVNEILEESGKRIVFLPETVKNKAIKESNGAINTIESVVKAYNESFNYVFIDVKQLTKKETINWMKIPVLLEKLNLSVWFEKCFISERLKEYPDNTVGVWDNKLQKIVILRSQLQNETDLFGTVIHEIIHATTGAVDVSRYFESELTQMIGKLSAMILSDDRIDDNLIVTTDVEKIDTDVNCDIDVYRITSLSTTGDIYWCDDCLGVLSCYATPIVEEDDSICKSKPFNLKCAVYIENNVSYWLMYNHMGTNDDFLYVITVDDAKNNIRNNMTVYGTVYRGDDISSLRDYMNTCRDNAVCKNADAEISTCEAYLLINRSLLMSCEEDGNENGLWTIAQQIRKNLNRSDEVLEKYIDEHCCPICGCYYTSYETACVKCGFDGINIDNIDELLYVEHCGNHKNKYNHLSRQYKDGLVIEGNKVLGFDKSLSCDTIIIPNGITEICASAFDSLNQVKNIYLSNTVEKIGEEAFISCENLVSIYIPTNVIHIGKNAFKYCYNLKYIFVDDDNQKFSSHNGNLYSKKGKKLLQYAIGKTEKEFSVPDGVTEIAESAFSGCCLNDISIPESVKRVNRSAFSHCLNVKSIRIGDSVKRIESRTFFGCDNLEKVYISSNIKSIGFSAFSGCTKLKSIIFDGTKLEWCFISKGYRWNYKTADYIVRCLNGLEIKYSETI